MNRQQIMAIRPALERDFFNSSQVASALEIALMGKKNVLLYGPGGHAKSMMVEAAMKAAGIRPFIKSFSEGTTVDDIYGGLDIPAYTNGELKHITQNSFLVHEVAVFEELFDAPAATLCSLKDTLTAKAYRQGAEFCKSFCNTIIAVTNVDPADITAMGSAQAALVERFPIQVEVKWDNYTKENYLNMLQSAYKSNNPTMELISILASRTDGNLSPRSCCHLYDSVIAAANLEGRANLTSQDLLKVVPFFKELGDSNEVSQFISKYMNNDKVRSELSKIGTQFNRIVLSMDNLHSPSVHGQAIAGLRFVNDIKGLLSNLKSLKVPDDVYETKSDLVEQMEHVIRKKTDEYTQMFN